MRIALLFPLAFLCSIAALPCAALVAPPPADVVPAALDSDHDGLSDALEQSLLLRFAPAFHTDPHDCAGLPALFTPNQLDPAIASENGTIYGQATPRALHTVSGPLVELRYFHLWKTDCGRYGHALDAEHVSVLVQQQPGSTSVEAWRALYWYAAAHQDTICDASQIARASTLHAENSGPPVFISRNKHASFLNPQLCPRGCGGDACTQDTPLAIAAIINIGEEAHPMNGAAWLDSPRWPLVVKLTRSDFDPAALARLQHLPDSDIAWVNPSNRPAQGTIAVANTTADAMTTANRKTDTALSLAENQTGSALNTTTHKVGHSLKRSAQGVGSFLHGDLHKHKSDPPKR